MKKTPVTVETVTSARDGADFTLTICKEEPRADSRLLALHLGNRHKSLVALMDRYAVRLRRFGHLTFQMSVGERAQGGGKAERYAMLNEDQALFVLALSRNTERVVDLKEKLIRAFAEARRAAELRQSEYLPAYHALHDAIDVVAADSPNRKWIHANANREVNKVVGLQAGQRRKVGHLQQSLLAVSCALAAGAVSQAQNRTGLQERIKTALMPLQGALLLQGGSL